MTSAPLMVSRQKQFDVNPVTWTVEWFHSLGFVIIGSIVLAMAGLGIQINPLDAPLIVAAVILLLGVPHGAFDVAIWCRRNSTAGPLAFAQMLVAYIGLASTFFGLWVFFPQLTLPAFLAISAIHFSDDWESSLAAIPRFVIAVALVASPAVFFYRDVITIFNLLAPSDVSEFAVAAMQFIAAPALSTSAVIVVILALRDPLTALEIVVVLALALLTPPMVFFLIYFCGLHSLRHVIHVHRELQPANISSFLLAAWPYAPLAILGTVIGGVTLSSLPIGHAVLGTVFIALGALTIPHMLLIDRFGAVTPR